MTHTLDTLRDELLKLIATEPDNVEAREDLWMQRENLRAELMGLPA